MKAPHCAKENSDSSTEARHARRAVDVVGDDERHARRVGEVDDREAVAPRAGLLEDPGNADDASRSSPIRMSALQPSACMCAISHSTARHRVRRMRLGLRRLVARGAPLAEEELHERRRPTSAERAL